ncbi:hypothetical protein IVB22_14445 [Bradyrhizobium sp. 190]|uniref:hypothetical protein n=1 Tax=Bradyrhizobium sp. 190 TaxID=2782658 RepID=UPI001FFB68DA|nr:hypothetical protein [Bradyrhizobium sp. 190]MCK1513747.1 hypothetical protein [Bradyrhizobium sp. 190]
MKSESEIKAYLQTPAGRLARHRMRRRKQVLLIVEGVEPRSKKMSEAERAAFQFQVAEQLEETKRTALRGPISAADSACDHAQDATQVHSIVKNLLDLLGRQGSADEDWQKKRFYKDDSQIQALSVSCVHGETRPSITIAARRLSTMIDDIELAAHATRGLDEKDSDHPHHEERDQECITSFRQLIDREAGLGASEARSWPTLTELSEAISGTER